MGKLPRDQHHDALIVIPTVANPNVLLPSFERLLRNLDGLRVHIIPSVNPKDQDHADRSIAGMEALWDRYKPEGSTLSIVRSPSLAGFGGAINIGFRMALGAPESTGAKTVQHSDSSEIPLVCGLGLPPISIIFNDDLHVTDGWITGMLSALNSKTVEVWAESGSLSGGDRPTRDMADYASPGRIGMVGPVTNLAAGIQMVSQDYREMARRMGLDEFSKWWREERRNQVVTADFLSGYCMGFTPDFIEDISEYTSGGEFHWLFDERYKVAGYEDNDLCARADRKGWRSVVAADTYIGHLGHQTFDNDFPDMMRGMANRLTYYDRWRPDIQAHGKRVVAVYRIRLDVPHDLHMFRRSLARHSLLVDGVAILLTANPNNMNNHPECAALRKAGGLPVDDANLILGSRSNPKKAMIKWANKWINAHSRTRSPDLWVAEWQGQFNERDERNELLRIGREELSADWILSIDHDEVLEPRIERAHLDRLMLHPDPMVQSWDLAFLNHWANENWVNRTFPWGDNGTYRGGMHGYRFFRVNKAQPRKIQAGGENGLHCGNTPQVDATCKRYSSFRFRHFGYMRLEDRARKLERYNEQDPNPNPALVGGTSYGHIMNGERQFMDRFTQMTGIGLTMLMYEEESADDLGRWLDYLYGTVDRVVVVWTGEWDEDHKAWTEERVAPGSKRSTMLTPPGVFDATEWPLTGPSHAVAKMAAHFGVEWVHEPLNDHLGNARNAGLDALEGTHGMGWALTVDPDEHYTDALTAAMLRRMAEVTDCWGWLVKFINRYDNGEGNRSEAVRMTRLDEGGIMRWDGRCHETFGNAVRGLTGAGVESVLRYAPFQMLNNGLSSDPVTVRAKLEKYRRLTEMDLQDNPNNAGPWVTLGLYWENDDRIITAMECYSRAISVTTTEFLPYHTMAMVHARLALLHMLEASERMGNSSIRKEAEKMGEALVHFAKPLKKLGHYEGWEQVDEATAMESLPPPPQATSGSTLAEPGMVAELMGAAK